MSGFMKTIVMGVLLGLVSPVSGFAGDVGPGFTYQGELHDAGSAVDGSFDFEFELFDQANNGASLAGFNSLTLDVEGGVFTADLDFGDTPFTGGAVWLEVRVRPSGGGNFTTLTPRQQITAAPYALHAQFVGADAISSLEIQDASIMSVDIAPGAIGTTQIDSGQVQRRLSNTCPGGQFMNAVSEDGTVTCAPDMSGASFWSLTGDGRIESDMGVVVNPDPAATFPFLVDHDSSALSPQIALVEQSVGDFTRINFYNQNEPARYWAVAGRILGEDGSADRLNIFNSFVGDVLTVSGSKHVGINNGHPTQALHVSQGQVRIDSLAHPGPNSLRTVKVTTSGDLVYDVNPAMQYLSMSGVAFKPSRQVNEYFANTLGAHIFDDDGLMVAPVQLPDGAKIHRFTAQVLDDRASNTFFVFLTATTNATPVSDIGISTLQTTMDSSDPQELTEEFDPPINVSTDLYSYAIQVVPTSQQWESGNQRIYNAVIEYTVED